MTTIFLGTTSSRHMILWDELKTGKMAIQDESEERVICPNCFTPNSEREHFCRKCGTPLTSAAVPDPLGQIYSEGDTYRKAIASPTKPIVLIGMWLIFGPMALFTAIGLIVI